MIGMRPKAANSSSIISTWCLRVGSCSGSARVCSPIACWKKRLSTGRNRHTATLLPSGQVLVAGGDDSRSTVTNRVELYEPANLDRVLRIGAKLVGVNNRNLHTFKVDLEHSLRLRREVPSDRVFVSESGIRNRQDVERLAAAGVQAMLVGETLMARPDIGAAVDELLCGP